MLKRDVRPIYLDEQNRARVLQVGDCYAPPPQRLSLRDRWPLTYAQVEVLLPVAVTAGLTCGARGAAAVAVTGAVSVLAQVLIWGRR